MPTKKIKTLTWNEYESKSKKKNKTAKVIDINEARLKKRLGYVEEGCKLNRLSKKETERILAEAAKVPLSKQDKEYYKKRSKS